jgi:hypothetical protein
VPRMSIAASRCRLQNDENPKAPYHLLGGASEFLASYRHSGTFVEPGRNFRIADHTSFTRSMSALPFHEKAGRCQELL